MKLFFKLFYFLAIFSGHPRFRTLANNIRKRRGKNVQINVKIFQDSNTKSPSIPNLYDSMNVDHAKLSDEQKEQFQTIAKEREQFQKVDHVYMDAMGFGMGCCCLQVTFQASTICEARILYDQLTPLCPILMALSAASPIFRGYLTDVDCRWSVISGSVDDRTDEEITGVNSEQKPTRKIPKSRFDSVDLYLCPSNNKFNDIDVCIDENIYAQLIEGGVDQYLARHMAHLFIRDPLVIFKEKIDLDDTKDSDHFEVKKTFFLYFNRKS